MKKSLLIILAIVSMTGLPTHAQIDYLGNHLESMRANNLRRHQQEMLSRKKRNSPTNQKRYERSPQAEKKQVVAAYRLQVGDVVSVIHYGKNNVTFKGRNARVASRAPLTINLAGTTTKPLPRGNKSSVGDFAIVTSTGKRSGVIGVMTLLKPQRTTVTRLK